ncbi:MAG: transport protein TonB [Alphaproteobacteria bacterium ADurb.BinA280]|jgi:protein TonB|nr:MAG: transport protein TonB [Alphaproteobacteria bacterium ADurb.BinA280]
MPTLPPRWTGVILSLLGMFGVLSVVLLMNSPLPGPEDVEGEAFSSIDVVKKEKPKSEPTPTRREPPKRRPQRSAPAPIAGLDSGLAGLNFGLPQFDASELDLGQGLLGEGGDVVMTDDSVDVPPRPIMQTPMAYPPRARAQGVTGYVLLSVLIGPTGNVEKVKVIEAQPAGVFDDVATAGVQTWKFEPASYRGENVRVWATQRVRFDLS